MTIIQRTERILKDLDTLAKDVEESAKSSPMLSQKVERFRLKKLVLKAQHQIRKEYFAFEDCDINQ